MNCSIQVFFAIAFRVFRSSHLTTFAKLAAVQTPPFCVGSTMIRFWGTHPQALGGSWKSQAPHRPCHFVVSQVHCVHVVGAPLHALLHLVLGLQFPLPLTVDLVLRRQCLMPEL